MLWHELLLPSGLVLVILAAGGYLVAVLETGIGASSVRSAWRTPATLAAWLLIQQANQTEAPDRTGWRLGPALYLALAALGLALVPWSDGLVPADLETGLVLWGSLEALATVVIFLHGWSANALFPLLGAYRYTALGLSYILISMFVLIAVALPAESLRFVDVVHSQEEVWNLVRQPLGLPLFLLVGLGVTFRGPLNLAQSRDLAGGVDAESSGPPRLVWAAARAGMLVAFSGVAATAFLGGWLGPWLPGALWLVLKMLFVLLAALLLARTVPRINPERCVALMWVVLLPLSFLHLAWAGVEALL